MLSVGLDVHQRTSTAHILDSNGKTVKSITVQGHWTAMILKLKSLKEPMSVCFEASCGYGTIYEELQKVAQRVVVANPGKVRLVFLSKRKSDRIDAEKLAKLLYLNEVPQVHVPKLAVRSWRELIEGRVQLIHQRVRIKNQIRALLRSYGVLVPSSVRGLWTSKGQTWLSSLTWTTSAAELRRDLLVAQLEHLNQMVRRTTTELNRIGRGHAGVVLLMTIPGIGARTAEAFVAYVDDPNRFAFLNQVSAYFGLVPCQDSSAEVNRLGHITKEGPASVRKLLTEAAWRCIDRCPTMRQRFDQITGGRKERRKIAVIAIARMLTRIMLSMLKSGEEWSQERLRGRSVEKAA